MSEYDNSNSGAFFKESEKKSDTHPDYSGSLGVRGTQCWASGWVRERDGKKELSLSIKEKDGGRAGAGTFLKNERKTNERHPDYKGMLSFDGDDFEIAGWKRTAKVSGKEFISVKVDTPRDGTPRPEVAQVTAGVADDEIPF